jgi:ABC-type phosphate transport system substrate-binding protein/ABC-type phosphate transport system permease subunit
MKYRRQTSSRAKNLTFFFALVSVVLFGMVIANLLLRSLPALVDPGLPGLFGIRPKVEGPPPPIDSGVIDIDKTEGKAALLKAKDIQFSEDDNVLVQGVLGSPYAIGYFGYAYYKENTDVLKAISVEGITPNEKTAEDNSYPLSRPLFIYSDSQTMQDKPQVAAYINFFLSHVNKEIEDVGYFPASTESLNEAKKAWLKVTSGEAKEGTGEVVLPEIDPSSFEGEISSAGSSTVFPLAERMAERFRNEGFKGETVIDSIGTGAGFERYCMSAETDIANASRMIRPEESGACETNGRTPIEFRVGTDAIAVVVSKENTFLDNVTREQLAQIFSTAEKWSDVDPTWPAEPIQRFSPGTDSGTFDYFVEAIMYRVFDRSGAAVTRTIFVFDLLPPIVGTLQMVLLALLVALPISMAIAILASEFSLGGIGRAFEVLLAVFSGIPSIIYGVFTLLISVMFIQPKLAGRGLTEQFVMSMPGLPQGLHPDVILPRNSMTTLVIGVLLSLLVIPFMAPMILDAIRNVPASLKEASMGLGATRWYTFRRVVLPGALSGIVAAASLGLLKVIGDVIIVYFMGKSSGALPYPIWDFMETNPPLDAFGAGLLGELVYGSDPSGPKGNVSYFVGLLLLLIAFGILWGAGRLQHSLQRRYSK